MSFYTGRTGSLEYAANNASDFQEVAKIRDWSIETTVELLSTTTIDSKVNTFTPGLMGATGSATIVYYRETDSSSANVEPLFNNIMMTGTNGVEESNRIQLKLKLGDGNKDTIKVNAYITSATIGTSTGELVSASINFTVDGNFAGRITQQN